MPAPPPFDSIDATTDDATIEELLREIGTAEVVRTGVHWLQERFDPVAAGAVGGVIQWEVSSEGDRHRWQLVVASGSCSVVGADETSDEAAFKPHVTLAASPVEFARIVSGAGDVMERFTAGQVLIAGNLPLARAMATWFPR